MRLIKTALQESVGDLAFNALFAPDPDNDHGSNRQTLTSPDARYFANCLAKLYTEMKGIRSMRECTLTGSVVDPLMKLVIQSPEYRDSLRCYNMSVGDGRAPGSCLVTY